MKLFKNVIFIRIISLVAVVLWMGVIFSFSAQNGTESKQTSGGVVQLVAKIITPNFDELTEAQKEEVCNNLSEFVRTAAHFCSFAVLGFLSLTALLTYKLKTQYKALSAWGFSVLYSVSDELHQYFIPDRACQLIDIIVDSLGALTGVLALVLLCFIIKKCRKEKKNGKKA